MSCNPVDVALKEISETKNLLESLITSSESFDYPKAKQALKQLQRKVRDLSKAQAQLEKNRTTGSAAPNVHMLDFRSGAEPRPSLSQ
jgi:cytochrome c556